MLGILCALAAGSASAAGTALPNLQSLVNDGARVSGLVVDLSQQKILAQLAPGERLTPASTTKLYTAAAALEHWGPDSTFATRFASNAAIENGVLKGDLVFDGAGDPDFDSQRLWLLVSRLGQAGVHEIRGNVIVNDHLFGHVVCLTADRCRARSLSDSAYDAPLSSAGINFSTIELTITPAANPGQPATLQLLPPGLAGFEISGTIETAASNATASYVVRRITKSGRHTLYVDGRVPAGADPIRVNRSIARPARYTAGIVARMLAENGIKVDGSSRVSSRPLPADYRILATVESPALAQQLRGMMTFSNNYMADTLTLDMLAYENAGTPLTLPLAAQFVEAYARSVNAQTYPWNQPDSEATTPLIIDSGSGLSISNRLSASDIVSLLAYMYRQSSTFPAFLGSLPVPLHTPPPSLKRGNLEWQSRVAAKTGSLSEPVSVRAVAGYFRLKSGSWGAFAFIVNGSKADARVPFTEANQAIIQDMEGILSQY